jgi:hypothetical protein
VEEQELAGRAAAAGSTSPELLEIRGLQALARRRYAEAESLLAGAEPHAAQAPRLRRWRILAAGLAGDRASAARLLAEAEDLIRGARSPEEREAWRWLSRRFDLPSVSGGRP